MMNELGLTREVIRQEMREIIEDVVTKQLGSGALDRYIEKAVNDAIKANRWDEDALKKKTRAAINAAVKKRIEDKVEAALNVEITLN